MKNRLFTFILAGVMVLANASMVFAQETDANQLVSTENRVEELIIEEGELTENDNGITLDKNGSEITLDENGNEQEQHTKKVDGSDYILAAGGFKIENPVYPESMYESEDGLLGAQESISDAIYKGLLERKEYIDVSAYNIYFDNYGRIVGQDDVTVGSYYYSVINTHPELYYVNYTYEWKYTYMGYDSTNGTSQFKLNGYVTSYKTGYDFDAFDKAKDKALTVVKSGMTDLEKAIALHEYIVLNTVYDYEHYLDGTLNEYPDVYNAYGVLVNQSAVCQGYAEAYQMLLEEVGIKAYLASSSSMSHAWNVIVLDGEYYQVDATWDDPVWDSLGFVRHTYMFLSDAAMSDSTHRHHDWTVAKGESDTDDIVATSTKYDNAYWTGVNSQLLYHKDNGVPYYYLSEYDSSSRKCKIVKVATNYESSSEKTTVINGIPRWNVFGSSSYYTNSYASLFDINNRIYYSVYDGICSVKYDGTDQKREFTADISTGYVYGAAYINGKVLYVLQQSPNESGKQTYLTAFTIDDAGENPEPDTPVAHIESVAIQDSGILAVNVEMTLPEEAYWVKITKGDGSELKPKSYLDNNEGRYKLSYTITAKEINDDFAISILDEEEKVIAFDNESAEDGVYITSLAKVCKAGIDSSESSDKMKKLCAAIYNYGQYAAAYFDEISYEQAAENVLNLGYSNLGTVSAEDLSSYVSDITGELPEDVSYVGSSLILEDSTTLRHYFRGNVNSYSVKADGNAKSPVRAEDSEDLYYVEVSNLAAPDYTDNHAVQIGSYTINYNPLVYCNKAVHKGSDRLSSLARALYIYHEAAREYY